MGLAFVRHTAICIAAVLCLSGALFLLRWMGLQQTPMVFEHPALRSGPLVIAKNMDVYEAHSPSLPGLWARVGLEHNKNYIWRTTAENQSLQLKELFSRFPKTSFLFELDTNSPNAAAALMDQLRKNRTKAFFYLNSQNEGLLKELKKQEPRWIYGAGLRQIMKARLFSAIFLEPLSDIRADFFVYSSLELGKKGLTPRLAKEIRRRNIQLIGETDSLELLKSDKILTHVSAVLTARPTIEMWEYLQAKAKDSPANSK